MKHRLFIAIDPAETTLGEIAALQPQLDKLKIPLAWEKHPHLTLNFLGQAEPKDVVPLIPKFPAFTLQPLYLDTLYSRHEPTIIYLSLAKSPELIELQDSLASSLGSITPQPRKFLPHITIARLKRTDPEATKRFMDRVSSFQTPTFSSFQVDRLVLYNSLLSHSGSTHQKLATFSLATF